MFKFLKDFKTKKLAFAVAALLTITVVGATMAYEVTETKEVTNTFKAGNIDTEVEETINGLTKTITVKNVENGVPCLVRIRLTATPSDVLKEGTISGTSWEKHGEFWYYMAVVTDQTQPLTAPYTIDEEVYNGLSAAEQAEVNVTVYHEAIQVLGDASTKDGIMAAWTEYDAQ